MTNFFEFNCFQLRPVGLPEDKSCLNNNNPNKSLIKCYNLYNLRSRLLQTTETLDSAIAAEPIHGCIFTPRGEKIPAATGIPT